MTRAQLYGHVRSALDNADLNGNNPCPVSLDVLVNDLLDGCASIEGISPRRVRPAVIAWKLSRCAVIMRDVPQEEQRRIDLIYQGAQL